MVVKAKPCYAYSGGREYQLREWLTFMQGMFYPSNQTQKGGVFIMQGYCVKCREKKEMKNAKAITMKNGRPATQGVCPSCGTKMFKIGK